MERSKTNACIVQDTKRGGTNSDRKKVKQNQAERKREDRQGYNINISDWNRSVGNNKSTKRDNYRQTDIQTGG